MNKKVIIFLMMVVGFILMSFDYVDAVAKDALINQAETIPLIQKENINKIDEKLYLNISKKNNNKNGFELRRIMNKKFFTR